MYNSDTELLFPIRVIPTLEALRGDEWRQLIQKVTTNGASQAEQIAFVLMMVRMSGCVACNADSFRAMRGCTQCARQSIRRFKGSDADLRELFEQSLRDVNHYLRKRASNEK